MTAQSKLKKAIRARMEETGENYTTARAAMLKAAPEKTPDQIEGDSLYAKFLKQQAAINARANLRASEFAPVLLTEKDLDLIEDALREGYTNCGEDADCLWAEPLAVLRRARATK